MVFIATSAIALFMFEIFLSIWLAFFFNPEYTYLVLGIAMIGLSAGGVYLAVRPKTQIRPEKFFLLFPTSILTVLFAGHWVSRFFNLQIEEMMIVGGKEGTAAAILQISALWTPLLGALSSVPFFLFSVLIGYTFQIIPTDKVSKVYALELICGAAGCVLAVLSVDYWGGYSSCVLLMLGFCILPVTIDAKLRTRTNIAGSLIIMVLTIFGLKTGHLEPRPQLNVMARNYDQSKKVTELWHDWTSYSRTTYLQVNKPGWEARIMVIGNGYGHAYVYPFDESLKSDFSDKLAPLLNAHKTPESSLVLFAGAARDMIDLYRYSQGKGDFTGIELNPKLVERALEDKSFNLESFFNKPNVHMEITEARAYLESTDKKFDLILLSWSGSTIAYVTGAVGHTAQFMFTTEAFKSIVKRLNPDGLIAVMNSNKVNLLSTLRTAFEEIGIKNIESTVMIVHDPTRNNNWLHLADENFALIKPDGFTAKNIEDVRRVSKTLSFKVIYDPSMPEDSNWPYYKVLHTSNLSQTIQEIGRPHNLRFSVSTDDTPYSLFLGNHFKWLDLEEWKYVFQGITSRSIKKWYPLMFVFALSLFAIITTFGPLIIWGPSPWSSSVVSSSLLFSFIGLGFMFIEMGIVHVVSIALETAGWTTAIAVAGLILSTGIGSLYSSRFHTKNSTFWLLAALILLLSVFYFTHSLILQNILGLSFLARILSVFAVIFPLGFLMGNQFAPALTDIAENEPQLIPWAWAFNGIGGTLAGLHAPNLSETFGFAFVIQVGLLCYIAVFLILAVKALTKTRLVGSSPSLKPIKE